MYSKYLRISLLALLLSLTSVCDGNGQALPFLSDSVSYLWPTDASRQLSSTFAETRSAHLHAGIDIRTWGQEGYRVFATRDGVVHRIGMSPYGYGNVLYLKHNDGSFSVYAHLNRFEPKLHAIADSIRFLEYRASIDEIIEHENIRYKQGEVIAYSGSTGIGPPHLHFELRTPDFKPFNPLLTNLSVIDNIPPVFRQLGIEHLDPVTLKPGHYEIVNARRSGVRYDFGEISVNGPVGLSVNVHDRANDTPNVYAVHTLTMMHEADTLFHSSADYFSFLHRNHMFLDRSYPILAQTRRGFQRLYRVSANQLPFYLDTKNNGLIHFEDGIYPVRIFATDIFGNRSVAHVTVHVRGNNSDSRPDIAHIPAYPDPPPIQEASLFNWKFLAIDHKDPLLLTASRQAVSYETIEAPYRVRAGNFIEKNLVPGKKSILSTPDQKTWLIFPENALHDSLQLRMNVIASQDEIFINFEPNRLPINNQIEFNFILPENMRHNRNLVLNSVDDYRNRRFYIRSSNTDGLIRANLREISNLVISEDNTAPWIGKPQLDRNLAGNHIVIVPARDSQTGIDYSRSVITVNGVKGLVEYIPDRNHLVFYNPKFRPERGNRIEITVYDGAGNRSTHSATL